MKHVQTLWLYRGFILGSVQREFQLKYMHSLLGVAWTFIQPLSMILVYTLVFSHIMGARLPGVEGGFAYSIYLCAGLLTWGLFAEIVTRSQTVFMDHANLLKKIHFPRVCLPVTVVITATLNFAIIFGLFTLFLLLSGAFPGWVYFALFPVLLLHVLLAVGLGMLLGVLNVFFRDVGQAMSVVLQFWFWLTPIVYPVSILPETAQRLLGLNPVLYVMQAYQNVLVNAAMPDWLSLWPVGVFTLLVCLLAWRVFRKHADDLVDEL